MDKDIVLKAIFDPIGSNKQEICTYYHRAAIAVDVVVLVVVLVTEQCSNPRVSIDLTGIFNRVYLDISYLCLASTKDPFLSVGNSTLTLWDTVKGGNRKWSDDQL